MKIKCFLFCFFFQAEDGIRDRDVTGVQTCALPIWHHEQRRDKSWYPTARPRVKRIVARADRRRRMIMERPSVRTESNGVVTTIILDRPDRRNAVDPSTAAALRAAFRAFERDRERRVAVLWGANGTFCAGYDLKAFAAAPRQLSPAYGEGPMGPTRRALSK